MNSQDWTTMKDIGKLIRDIRKQQGVTQEELAGISGTGRRFISDVENGKNNIQTGKLLLVIKAKIQWTYHSKICRTLFKSYQHSKIYYRSGSAEVDPK